MLTFYLSPKRQRRMRYALSDTPGDGAKAIDMKPEDFIAYQQAKKEYERWRRKLAHFNRTGWIPSWL